MTLATSSVGCVQTASRIDLARLDKEVVAASHESIADAPPDIPALTGPVADATAVQAYVQRALVENRTVQAARHNVMALRHRIRQVTALDDPVVSNTIFPVPSVAPQYSLMGYNPYNMTLAQQFPWFGTLQLRGQVAERDAQVALAELAAAQLDTVAAVKRAYHDLHAALTIDQALQENHALLVDFQTIARQRLERGGSQQDVLRAEVLLSELQRDRATNRQAIASARAALGRQVHASPNEDLRTAPEVALNDVPFQVDQLQGLAMAARPELQGRLAAVARDEVNVALAHKRSMPNITLGLTYMNMEKTNSVTPATAAGMPNVGLFVGFNVPLDRTKYRAGVSEAQERALADLKLYEAQLDETLGELRDLFAQVQTQRETLGLLRDQVLPRTKNTLELAGTDYAAGNVDFPTMIAAQREVLMVRIQIAQAEAELGKALASLERAVGTEINQYPTR